MNVNWDIVTNTLVSTLFGLYGGKANPEIPEINKLFENDLFKTGFVAAMIYLNTKDPQIAVVVALLIHVLSAFLKKKKLF